MKRILLLLPILLTSAALAAEKLPLAGDEYTFTQTHEAKHPKVQFPRDEIPEKEYQATKERSTLHLKFSKDRDTVQILPRGIGGKLAEVDAKKRVYDLTKGLFAGGKLVIESTEKGMTATLTEFGSGVPVISSVRGALSPGAPKTEK